MKDSDTTLGGPGHEFPSTHWSALMSQGPSSPPARRERLAGLLQAYWKPVYWHVRRLWEVSNEDAKDLTQDFLCHLLEADLLARVAPERGRLRSYLKAALRNFLINAKESAGRQKRGGGAAPVRIDAMEGPGWEPAADAGSPDEVFDREWAKCVLVQAAAAVEGEFREAGRPAAFEALRLLVLDPPADELSYRDVAARLRVSEDDVRNYLYEGRGRLKRALRKIVAAQVSSSEDLEEELAALFGRVWP